MKFMTPSELKKIQDLPLNERIAIIQTMWDDIAREQSYDILPEEHKNILEERINRISDGNSKFKSWDDIKKKYILD